MAVPDLVALGEGAVEDEVRIALPQNLEQARCANRSMTAAV
ncbi:hypothetical protein M2163_000355 [Streptomyces sp. SAI-135]|nr:hypothetical protein [Streptomyces sp. SAI-090]MDH6574024.1 hypothetical protein [Streptomyces sp. SAI-117]MDH6581239.1 hypothetical protein [Streptomyces sp. SAI-133]MDH6613247.1 hypothetical protein [Streptomyces sp. SAI-135]